MSQADLAQREARKATKSELKGTPSISTEGSYVDNGISVDLNRSVCEVLPSVEVHCVYKFPEAMGVYQVPDIVGVPQGPEVSPNISEVIKSFSVSSICLIHYPDT